MTTVPQRLAASNSAGRRRTVSTCDTTTDIGTKCFTPFLRVSQTIPPSITCGIAREVPAGIFCECVLARKLETSTIVCMYPFAWIVWIVVDCPRSALGPPNLFGDIRLAFWFFGPINVVYTRLPPFAANCSARLILFPEIPICARLRRCRCWRWLRA